MTSADFTAQADACALHAAGYEEEARTLRAAGRINAAHDAEFLAADAREAERGFRALAAEGWGGAPGRAA